MYPDHLLICSILTLRDVSLMVSTLCFCLLVCGFYYYFYYPRHSIMTCTIKAKKTFLDKMKQQRNVCVINNQYIPHYFITTLPNHYEDGWRSIAHVVHNSDVLYSKHY